ncbi:hypothetical protein IGI04_025378 [Brassica rapa subsp. trilocularis]|uniref:RWP-RK domain-containing protein n=1 Tax=Brassica rapa subsp. trilocularis TaxID=1813537 RepID=A0ABQ7M9H1_BRACM|nr:hypothetical protein IGI04_025378 [Brassica rapa subsp. trilocularis]
MGGEKELLIQLWVPVERGMRRVLSTEEQPYSLNLFSQSQSLALYRDISAGYSFAAEVGSDQLVGLPGRVFLNRMPEWTPDVRFFRSEEYLRIGYAHRCQVRASLALPLFQGPSGTCMGVLEMITTHPSLEYGSQLHTIHHALQAFDLRSSETSIVPTSLKVCLLLSLRFLIFALSLIYSIDGALSTSSTAPHREVASILKGICISYGLPLAITWGHQQDSCLSAIVSASYASDQNSRSFLDACSEHHLVAKEGIAGRAFATKKQYRKRCGNPQLPSLPLRQDVRPPRCSCYSSPDQIQPQRPICSRRPILLASQLSLRFQSSPHLMVDDDQLKLAECMSRKGKGKDVSVSSFSYSSSYLESRKRKRRDEKDITLDILRQHFAGSLKDAAKNIGVCPTTLKRICRQHGISRWPSRKIKKVGHSLRKLQVVMDSVEGVQGSHHLASFYSSFPQLQSPLQLDPSKTVAKSPPPSSSSSGSSTCCSSEEKEKQLGGGFHKPSSQVLLTLSSSLMKDEQRPVRATSSLPPLPSARKAKDAGMKVHAMFGDSKMIMRLKHHWGIADLRREIAKGFGMDDDALTSNFTLKYMDDDEEWVLLTCDADLEECIQIYKSSLYKETVRISVSSLL